MSSDNDRPQPENGDAPASDPLLNRVRSVAQMIADRVHTALSHSAPSRQPRADIPNRLLRVLVVDDNVDAADALAAVAELLGCETRSCYGGAEALDALRAELPDALLLDLAMPGVGGLEVATRARALVGEQPLLLVATTGHGSLEDRTATALAGFHFHLVKPIDTAVLRAVLDRFRALRHPGTAWQRGDGPGEPAWDRSTGASERERVGE
jgi:CheY-like chemotaxis protein